MVINTLKFLVPWRNSQDVGIMIAQPGNNKTGGVDLRPACIRKQS